MGERPADAVYGYLMLPGATPERLAATVERPDIRVLSNTPALQAIHDGGGTFRTRQGCC